MKNLKSFGEFSETPENTNESTENLDTNTGVENLEENENIYILEEGMIRKFFSGHESIAAEDAAEKKFTASLEDAEKALKASPKDFAQAGKWEVHKAFLMGQAAANRFRGGLRVQKGRDGRIYIVYDEKSTGFQNLASSASGEANVRK